MRDVLSTSGKSLGKWRGHSGPLYPTCLKLLSLLVLLGLLG